MSIKMKVAFLLTPIDFGGAEKVSLNFLQNVDRKEIEIFPIIFIRPWEKNNRFVKFLQLEKYIYYEVPVARKPPSEGRDYFRFLNYYRIINSILTKISCHVLHTNGYLADLIGIPCARRLQIPCISTCHGYVPIDKKLQLYGFIDRIVLRFCSKIIAVSEELKKELIQSGIKGVNIQVIQNAVTQNYSAGEFSHKRRLKRKEIGIRDGEMVIGYIGRLSKEKGVEYLIEACAILEENNVPFRLLVVGEGPEKKEIKAITRRKGIMGSVYFAGFQNDIENWMAALDIFILPSLTEGTPLALLEAMSMRLPVVASAVGGVPKIIENMKNGILVSPANPDQIAAESMKIFKNNEYSTKMGKAASETIANKFNINQWIDKIKSVYTDILTDHI